MNHLLNEPKSFPVHGDKGRRGTGTLQGCTLLPLMVLVSSVTAQKDAPRKPNILFVISDDQSYPYASAYGTTGIRTPAFDKIAGKGILFTNAFVTSPGCSPSRASILTGRYPWQLEEAGTHGSSFPLKYKTFTQVLEENGYAVGYTGKPWDPGDWQVSGWKRNPAGQEFNEKKLIPPWSGISKIDYAGNLELFLTQKKADQPFFFWMGAHEPHRVFEEGSGIKAGKSEAEALVPGFLPDLAVVKSDLLDYYLEIEWFDNQLALAINMLEEMGELDNTLVIVTSDNGMSFPRAKANLYDAGIHVPLAICWGGHIPKGCRSGTLVSTVDLAPTILEVAGLRFTGSFPMAGKSMLGFLIAGGKKNGSPGSHAVFAGRERHSSSRYENRGYPQRAVRTDKYLYIRNYHSEYWPAGDPRVYRNDGSLSPMHFAYFDIDDGPTLRYYQKVNLTDPLLAPLFLAATAKRSAEELYDIRKDPDCLENLAGKKNFDNIRKKLSALLSGQLIATGDPRETGSDPEIWESYPRLKGEIRKFPPAE